MRKSRAALIFATALAAVAGPLHAQSSDAPGDNWSAPGWMGDAAFLSVNALASGVTAGVFRKLRGESFTDGFARGALGGSVHYAGLRIGVGRFDGAGLIGRQVSAAGASMVRNASDGIPVLERMFVPLGPLHLYVDLAVGVTVRPKINLAALTMVLSAAAEPALDWDARATLSAGAPVFRAPGRTIMTDDRSVGGYVRSGSIFMSDVQDDRDATVLAHERVHVMQGDWLFLTWSDPMESWLLKRIPLGSHLYRYFDIDLVAASVGSAAYDMLNISDANRLHEIEAYFLDSR